MKFQSASYMLLIIALQVLTTGGSSLRGHEPEKLKGLEYDFSKLKCTFEAWSSAEKCSDSVNKEGEACSYCIMKDNGQEAGLCVDPEIAPNMEAMNPKVTCSTTNGILQDENLEGPDFHDFKCAIEAFTDPEKCSLTKTDDGKEWCQYCSMDGPFGEQGLCVSPEHAEKLKKIGAPALHCASRRAVHKETVVSNDIIKGNPITDCNLKGADMDTCLDPQKVNGSDCVWCDAGIGGFCLPQSWQQTASRFLKCQEREEKEGALLEDTEPVETEVEDSILDFETSTFDSSCIKEGMSAATPDDCRNLIDGSGEHCIFCKSPTFGGIGLCMPPSYRGKEGRFYECDKEASFVEVE